MEFWRGADMYVFLSDIYGWTSQKIRTEFEIKAVKAAELCSIHHVLDFPAGMQHLPK